MVNKNKLRKDEVYQTLIFDLDIFDSKKKVKNWIKPRDKYIIKTSKGKNAIAKYNGSYRVRQIEPSKFKNNTYPNKLMKGGRAVWVRRPFRTMKICKGVKAVVGVLK